jgi:hypothetical protein
VRDGTYPHDVSQHLGFQLAKQPPGTRVVLVWDPEQYINVGTDLVDAGGKPWKTREFAGQDAQFATTWRSRGTNLPTVVLLRPSGHNNRAALDLSFQEGLLSDADALLDLTLRSVLKEYTGIAWESEAVQEAAVLITKNLSGTLAALSWARPGTTVARHDLLAAALAANTPAGRPDDFLRPPQGPAPSVLLQGLNRLYTLPPSSREIARSLLREVVRDDRVDPWLELPTERAVQALLVGATLHALGRRPDALTLRGAGIEGDTTKLVGLLVEVTEDDRWAESVRALATLAERDQDVNTLDRLVGIVDPLRLESLTDAVEGLTPRARDRFLRRALMDLASRADAVAVLRTLTCNGAWTGVEHPDRPPLGGMAAAIAIFASVARRLEQLPQVSSAESLADVYVLAELPTLELDLAQAMEFVRREKDRELTRRLIPLFVTMRRTARHLLSTWDRALANAITDCARFNESDRSVSHLLSSEVFGAGRLPPAVPHVWLVIFDGMRWDTWERVIRPALVDAFEMLGGDASRFALLPSITKISRTSAMAGAAPPGWRNASGAHTANEEALGLRGFRLPPGGTESDWRLIKRADEDVDVWVVEGQPRHYNTVVYNISDDRIHKFDLDVAELNRELRQRIADRVVQDMLTAVDVGDILIVTSDHGFIELDPGDAVDLEIAQGTVNYRYVAGTRLNAYPSVDLGEEGLYSMAVGRQWFRRSGGTFTRYSHGGLSFDELLVPGAVFRHSGAPRLELHWRLPAIELAGMVREPLRAFSELVNRGNRTVYFTLRPSDDRIKIEPQKGTISARDGLMVAVTGELSAGQTIVEVGGSYGLDQTSTNPIEPLIVSVQVEEVPGKVEIDYGALELLDRE